MRVWLEGTVEPEHVRHGDFYITTSAEGDFFVWVATPSPDTVTRDWEWLPLAKYPWATPSVVAHLLKMGHEFAAARGRSHNHSL